VGEMDSGASDAVASTFSSGYMTKHCLDRPCDRLPCAADLVVDWMITNGAPNAEGRV
jgi:hypothetical protein